MKTNNRQLSLLVNNPREAYRQVRNYLAGRLVGITRDDALLQEVIKCLFCKLHLKRRRNEIEDSTDVLGLAHIYRQAFSEVRSRLPNLFSEEDELLLDPTSLAYLDQMLGILPLDDPAYDPFGDAYEVFIGSGIRGQEGQFFTPQNAADLLVSIITPKPGEKIIDPACGSGTFLSAAARSLIKQGALPEDVAKDIVGVDKDRYLAGLASARLGMVTLAPARVYCADSLSLIEEDGSESSLRDELGKFDVVLTNPPFGARIVSVSPSVQPLFELGHRWKFDSHSGKFTRLGELQPSVPPQVLFVERCLSLVRPRGRIGMVVPESLISGSNYRFVVEYIRSQGHIRAVIGMPESLFKTSGKGGTHTKTCLIYIHKNGTDDSARGNKVFMADAQWCGRDSRGHQIERDELPEISNKYEQFLAGRLNGHSHLGYGVPVTQIIDSILAPRYYNPDVNAELSLLSDTHTMVTIKDLVASGLLEITTGDEVGKLTYGSGTIPFVRTSDISNWEVKVDPKHSVSEEIYKSLASKQDVKEGDILFVRDGTYLVGTCAYITKYDTKIVFQSHMYKLRVRDHSKLSPYLLLAALNSPPVKRQIKAKRFTQDIIDSLGGRIYELVLPIPKDKSVQEQVANMVKRAIDERSEARELTRKACLEVVGMTSVANHNQDA
jgi:type I restriction enzyme M protein